MIRVSIVKCEDHFHVEITNGVIIILSPEYTLKKAKRECDKIMSRLKSLGVEEIDTKTLN